MTDITKSTQQTILSLSEHFEVYKTSYPIYSTYGRVRVFNSPARLLTRLISSPVRVTRTIKSRISITPDRIISYPSSSTSLSTSVELTNLAPTCYYSSYTPTLNVYNPRPFIYSPIRQIFTRPFSPIISSTSSIRPYFYLNKVYPRYDILPSTFEPFESFKYETNRIRTKAQSLMRDLHAPIIRSTRSTTPFPFTRYEPLSEKALDAYVARITNPVRHIAKEVHRMSWYPESTRKFEDSELDPNRPSRKFSVPRSFDNLVKCDHKTLHIPGNVNEEESSAVESEKPV